MKVSFDKNFLLLLLIVLLGLTLRLYHLDYFPLWGDEAFTRFYSESSLSYMWTTGFQQETNPPGYYMLMHAWMHFFGTSEIALRMPSAIASILAILLVYALGREFGGSRVGLIAALVMAVAPTNLWSGQEVRTYALNHLPIGLALLGLAWFLARPSSIASLVVFAFAAVTAAYTHDTAVLVVVACNLAVLAAAFGQHALLNRGDLVRWAVANAVVAVVLLPLVITMWGQRASPNLAWIPPLAFGDFVGALSEVIGGRAGHAEYPHCRQVLLLAVLALALCRLDLPRRTLLVLVVVPVLYVALVLFFSVNHSIVQPRIFYWCLIPISLLVALTLTRPVPVRWLVLVMMVFCFLPGLVAQLAPAYNHTEDWDNFLTANKPQLDGANTILLGPETPLASLAYYYPEGVSRMKFWPGDPPAPRDFSHAFMCNLLKIPEISTHKLLSTIDSARPVSLLLCLKDVKYLNSPASPIPPAPHRFDDVLPNTGELHLLSWNNN